MGPLTRSSRYAHKLHDAAHIVVPMGMWNRLTEIHEGLPFDAPMEGLLPHETTVIEVEGYAAFLFKDLGDEVSFAYLNGSGTLPFGNYCSYVKRGLQIGWNEDIMPPPTGPCETWSESYYLVMSVIFKADLLFSLMAEPRFVEQTPVSRIKRGIAAKKLGQKALRNTWVKVGWTIGAPTRAKGDPNATAPQKAYHLRRAHWRHYDHRTENSERRPHRPGWWVWVKSHHVGHPALGEIKHHYTPTLDDPGKSSKVVHAVVGAKIAQTIAPDMRALQ